MTDIKRGMIEDALLRYTDMRRVFELTYSMFKSITVMERLATPGICPTSEEADQALAKLNDASIAMSEYRKHLQDLIDDEQPYIEGLPL